MNIPNFSASITSYYSSKIIIRFNFNIFNVNREIDPKNPAKLRNIIGSFFTKYLDFPDVNTFLRKSAWNNNTELRIVTNKIILSVNPYTQLERDLQSFLNQLNYVYIVQMVKNRRS